jgi:hypothetical protein
VISPESCAWCGVACWPDGGTDRFWRCWRWLGNRIGAINNQKFTDVLNSRGAKLAADFFKIGFAIFSDIAEYANLDQSVSLQINVDLFENGFGKTVFGNRDNGIETVSTSAQFAALIRR